MDNTGSIYDVNIPNQFNPDSHYGLRSQCGKTTFGTFPPNSLGEAYLYKPLQEAASFNMNNSANSNSNDLNNDNPSLRQADVAYTEGGSTTGNLINNNGNFSGNNYIGDLQQIKPIQNIDKMDDSTSNSNQSSNGAYYGATFIDPIRHALGISVENYYDQPPVTAQSVQYHNGFLRTQVGRRVTVDFLVGTNQIMTKTGYLLGVANDYILINELDTNDITTCDFYNIKFMKFYY